MTFTIGQIIIMGFGVLLMVAGAFVIGWDLHARHYRKWHGFIAADYARMSEEFERLARKMQSSDEMRAGIDLGQESVLTEFERLSQHMRETLAQRG